MTDIEAEEMLAALTKHYGEAVRPASEHCNALMVLNDVLVEAGYLDRKATSTILFTLHKSNLAARLLYGGEKLRTRKCPEHDGHWSGIPGLDSDCEHGCGLTGWLPETSP